MIPISMITATGDVWEEMPERNPAVLIHEASVTGDPLNGTGTELYPALQKPNWVVWGNAEPAQSVFTFDSMIKFDAVCIFMQHSDMGCLHLEYWDGTKWVLIRDLTNDGGGWPPGWVIIENLNFTTNQIRMVCVECPAGDSSVWNRIWGIVFYGIILGDEPPAECNICSEIDCEGDCNIELPPTCEICGEADCEGDCNTSGEPWGIISNSRITVTGPGGPDILNRPASVVGDPLAGQGIELYPTGGMTAWGAWTPLPAAVFTFDTPVKLDAICIFMQANGDGDLVIEYWNGSEWVFARDIGASGSGWPPAWNNFDGLEITTDQIRIAATRHNHVVNRIWAVVFYGIVL